MSLKPVQFYGLICLVLALAAGCKKSEARQSQPSPWANEPVVTFHWSGMKQVSNDPMAAGFLKIWHLPETGKLLGQTLDKLALAPWRLSGTNSPPAVTNFAAAVRQNPSAALLRPLLDDLVQEEFYLEARDQSGPELALAVHLERTRAGVWESNLAHVVETATGARRGPSPSTGAPGWRINGTAGSPSRWLRQVELCRLGDWTVVAFGTGQNQVFSNLLSRIKNAPAVPFGARSNAWLQTAFDLRRASAVFSWGWDLPQDWPRVSLDITGNATGVVTHGRFHFANPLPEIEPWNIPTDLIHEPLHSFTAVRGVKSLISSLSWWQNLHASSAPDQIFFWGQNGSPFSEYASAPVTDAAKLMSKLAAGVMDTANPILASNGMGKWDRTGSGGLSWSGAPMIAPFIRAESVRQGSVILAGLAPAVMTNSPPPTGTLKDLLSQPNVVYFDREITAPRIEVWIYNSQLFRLVMRRAQLPTESTSIPWLRAIGPMLGSASTTVAKTNPTDLVLTRTSGVGLTAFELHLLADWLESSQFPMHMHTTVAKLPSLPIRQPAPGGAKPVR